MQTKKIQPMATGETGFRRLRTIFIVSCTFLLMLTGVEDVLGEGTNASSLTGVPLSGMALTRSSNEGGKLALPPYGGNPELGKISSNLLGARRLLGQEKAVQAESIQQLQGITQLLPVHDGLLDIEIRLRTLTPEIVEQLRPLCAEIQEVHYPFARVYALCAPDRLDEIAAIPEVTTIHANYPPTETRAA